MVAIAVVGGYWGSEERKQGQGFAGGAGMALRKMLAEAGIDWTECVLTNVFNLMPPHGKIEYICTTKAFGIPGYPSIGKSKYIDKIYEPELERLQKELLEADPNIIIAMGNEASWALLGKTVLKNFRGTTQLTTHTVGDFKVICTYNPVMVFKDFSLRPIMVMDLCKAERESHFPEIRRPKCEIWIEPTLEDLYEFDRQYIQRCRVLSVDIETAGDRITCIGFAPNECVAIVIPFADNRKANRSYWSTSSDERRAWDFVREICEGPTRKLFQNGLYDIAFLWRANKIGVMNAEHDTMLLHHALQPESLKSLGFLGSLYTDHGPWKHMRSKNETIKKDD